jgi:predicted aminopeptidase
MVALLAATTGCANFSYLLKQSISQLGVLARSVPIEDVLEAGERPEEELAKLRLIVEAREFARKELGLRVRGSYRKFHDTRGKAMAYNLAGCKKDSLTPKRWHFPIIGWIDYIGYFEEEDAIRAEKALQAEGYDTMRREVDAFSTLGWLPDPVHSTLLRRDELGLVEVVIHEVAHNTVYANGQSDFNESLATFIGRRGAVLFYEQRGDAESVGRLHERYEDQDRVNQWLIGFVGILRAHYAQEIPREKKIAGREAVFEAARERYKAEFLPKMNQPRRYRGWGSLETNNARVRLNMRYNKRQDLFQRLLEQGGGEMRALLEALRRAARSRKPFEALERAVDSR